MRLREYSYNSVTKQITTPLFMQGEWFEGKMQIPIVTRMLSINRYIHQKVALTTNTGETSLSSTYDRNY